MLGQYRKRSQPALDVQKCQQPLEEGASAERGPVGLNFLNKTIIVVQTVIYGVKVFDVKHGLD